MNLDSMLRPRAPGAPAQLVCGTMNFGKRTAAAESERIMARALERGIAWFDTANAYNDGESERIVGKALRPRRGEVLLATKCGIGPEIKKAEGLARNTVLRACEDSLSRLGADKIDLYKKQARKLQNPDGSFATGYVSQPGAKLALPDTNTLWTADGSTLTPATPVTLSYDNGQGLVFHRKISIDDNYMLQISDTVESGSVKMRAFINGKQVGDPLTDNAYSSDGIAPVKTMFELGVNVGLGSDGSYVNCSMDMIQQMKFAALIQNVIHYDPTLISSERALEMATINSAKALGIDHLVGSLEASAATCRPRECGRSLQ